MTMPSLTLGEVTMECSSGMGCQHGYCWSYCRGTWNFFVRPPIILVLPVKLWCFTTQSWENESDVQRCEKDSDCKCSECYSECSLFPIWFPLKHSWGAASVHDVLIVQRHSSTTSAFNRRCHVITFNMRCATSPALKLTYLIFVEMHSNKLSNFQEVSVHHFFPLVT